LTERYSDTTARKLTCGTCLDHWTKFKEDPGKCIGVNPNIAAIDGDITKQLDQCAACGTQDHKYTQQVGDQKSWCPECRLFYIYNGKEWSPTAKEEVNYDNEKLPLAPLENNCAHKCCSEQDLGNLNKARRSILDVNRTICVKCWKERAATDVQS